MVVIFVICFTHLLSTCNAISLPRLHSDVNPHSMKEEEPLSKERQTRSVYAAWKALLKSAISEGKTAHTKMLYKPGGLSQAMKDFDSLSPTQVVVGGDGFRTGRVGDRFIFLLPKDPASLLLTGKKHFTRIRYFATHH